MINKVIISLLVTSIVSLLFALIFKDVFWYVFTLAFILQISISLVYNQIYTNKLFLDLETIKIEQLKESSRNLVDIVCPCSAGTPQRVDFRFDQKVIYECTECKKTYIIMADLKPVLTTEPVYFDDR